MKETAKRSMNSIESHRNKSANKALSLKRSDTVTQKIEEISHKMKEEHKSKSELQRKFDIQIKKIEESKERLEGDLQYSLGELNKMELKVYELQKANLERFKTEIIKYENVHTELRTKSADITEQLDQSKAIDSLLYNQTFMLREDYLSYGNELILLRNKVEAKIIQLKEIESNHPKEFKFMQEEFQLENTLKTITIKSKANSHLIKRNFKDKESNSRQRELLLKQTVNAEVEMDALLKEMESIKEDEMAIVKLEDSIKSAVTDAALWEKMREMMKLLFSDPSNGESVLNDNGKDKRVMTIEKLMLKVKMDLMQLKKAKASDRSLLEQKLNELKKKTVHKNEHQKHNESIAEAEEQLSLMSNEVSAIEGNIALFEVIFNKYIVLFKNEAKESNDIESRFKYDMISILIGKKPASTGEPIQSFSLLLSKYFKDQTSRDKKQKELQSAKSQLDDKKNFLNHSIDTLNKAITTSEQQITKLQSENAQIASDVVTLTETIHLKNKNLKTNLEALGEDQFSLYLDTNDTALKNMKKIYGNKILNKVFKVQKDKFLETVIVDHSLKKAKVNDSLEFIVQYESIKSYYKSQRETLEANYQALLQKYEACLEFQAKKEKERGILDDSAEKLKKQMEAILDEQLKVIQSEKQNLHLKFNVSFYIEQVREISEQIEQLSGAKTRILEEFEAFEKVSNEKGHQLFFKRDDLKRSVASLNGVIAPQDETLMTNGLLPLSSNSKVTEEGNVIQDVEDSVRRSLRDFNKNIEITKVTARNDYVNDLIASDNSNIPKSQSRSTQANQGQYTQSTAFENFSEKLRPLISGLTLYKKFDSKTMSSKTNAFDPFKADKWPPETCGYALRYFKLTPESKMLAIKRQSSSYHSETKVPLSSLVAIFIGQSSKDILKVQEHNSANPSHQIDILCKTSFIPFTLVLTNSKIDLIAPNYLTYTSFEGAIKDLILNKHQIECLMDDLL